MPGPDARLRHPSLDTTILGITNTIALFAEHPDQWDLLRADRSLIPHAINESLRLESPVPQFSRVLTRDQEVGGVPLPEGARVALLYGAANRDPRKYQDPARFDITRRPSDHLAFGRGEHACIGMNLARLGLFPFAGRSGCLSRSRRPLAARGTTRYLHPPVSSVSAAD